MLSPLSAQLAAGSPKLGEKGVGAHSPTGPDGQGVCPRGRCVDRLPSASSLFPLPLGPR